MITVEEMRASLDKAIREKRIQVRTGEGTQAELDDLLERRLHVKELHTFIAIVCPEEE